MCQDSYETGVHRRNKQASSKCWPCRGFKTWRLTKRVKRVNVRVAQVTDKGCPERKNTGDSEQQREARGLLYNLEKSSSNPNHRCTDWGKEHPNIWHPHPHHHLSNQNSLSPMSPRSHLPSVAYICLLLAKLFKSSFLLLCLFVLKLMHVWP